MFRRELEWFYEDKGGVSMVFPDYFEEYRDFIPHVSVCTYTLTNLKCPCTLTSLKRPCTLTSLKCPYIKTKLSR